MTQPRHVEFKSSVCSLCGGTHYGSTECPYRCERCTTNTDPCHLPDCPRNARWAAENAAADARIAADRGKPLAREQIEHHLRECRMNTQPKHTLPRDRLMALCEAALRSLPTEELSLTKEQARRAWHRKIGCTTWESCPTEKECRAFDAGFDAASAVSPRATQSESK